MINVGGNRLLALRLLDANSTYIVIWFAAYNIAMALNSSMQSIDRLKQRQSQAFRMGIAGVPERSAQCTDLFLTSGDLPCLAYLVRPPWSFRLKT
jgi:hypothetical protein